MISKTLKNFLPAVSVVALTVFTAGAWANITPFSASYSLNIDGKSGTATRTLTKSGNGFNYKMSARVAGVATANQSANFTLSGGRVVPSSATTSYKVAGIGSTHNIKFSNSKVISTYKGKSKTLSSTRQAYDDLSLEMQIRQELISGKFSGSYPLVKKNEVESTIFRKAGTTKIKTPAGSYEVVRIDRVHGDKGRITSFWLAPSLNYLPIKVTQTDDGKTMTMTLSKINK